jgi:hypothetical protein
MQRILMGKNPNTFQKRQREFEKKRKAEDKRKRRQAQKDAPPSQVTPATDDGDEKSGEET